MKTSLVLDECQELGEIAELLDILSRGRSSNVGLLLGTQTVELLEYKIGKEAAAVVLGMTQTHIAFRTMAPHTAAYLEIRFSSLESWEPSVSYSQQRGWSSQVGWSTGATISEQSTSYNSGFNGNFSYNESETRSISYSKQIKPIITSGVFMNLAEARPDRDEFEYCGVSAWWSGRFILKTKLLPAESEDKTRGFIPRDITRLRFQSMSLKWAVGLGIIPERGDEEDEFDEDCEIEGRDGIL